MLNIGEKCGSNRLELWVWNVKLSLFQVRTDVKKQVLTKLDAFRVFWQHLKFDIWKWHIGQFLNSATKKLYKLFLLNELAPLGYVMQTPTDFEVCWWFLNPFHFYLICSRCNDAKFKCIRSRVWLSLEYSWVEAAHLDRITSQCEKMWLHLQSQTHVMLNMA